MGKEKTAFTADDLVKSTKDTQDKIPGKSTQVRGTGVDAFDRDELCVRQPNHDGCFMDEKQRSKILNDLRSNMTTAATNFKQACLQLKIETMLKKEEDLNWVASILLDLAGSWLIGLGTKAVLKLRTLGKLDDFSDDTIKTLVKSAGGFGTKKAQSVTKSVGSEQSKGEKTAKTSYLDLLQNEVDTSFRNFALYVMDKSTDEEILVVSEAMTPDHHRPEDYRKAIEKKLQQYMASGVTRIGRGQREGNYVSNMGLTMEDRRVVWVTVGGERHLFFQHHYSRTVTGPIGPGGHWPKEDGKFGERNPDDKPVIGKPVPREFWDIALAANEAKWGITPLVLDKASESAAATQLAAQQVADEAAGGLQDEQ